MAIEHIRATIRCDGCSTTFTVNLDPAQKMREGMYETVFEYAEWMVRAGDDLTLSVQGGHHLCTKCTKVVDDAFPDTSDLTHDQVADALNKAAGL